MWVMCRKGGSAIFCALCAAHAGAGALGQTAETPTDPASRARAALAEFDPEQANEAALADLEATLMAMSAAGAPPDELQWSGWLEIARARFVAGMWDEAYQAGQNVINVMDLAAGAPDSARVEAASIAGEAALQSQEFEQAHRALSWGAQHLPKQREQAGRSAVNPEWAQLAVRAGYAATAYYSHTGEEVPATEDVFSLDEMTVEGRCPGVEWRDQPLPLYPAQAVRDKTFGSVILEYGFQPDGRTRDVAIVAEAPLGIFGANTKDALEEWRARPATVTSCLGERFIFEIIWMIPQ